MSTRILTLASALIVAVALRGQVPGSVTGTVLDDSGHPVVRARVFISSALPATTARPAAPPVITGPQVISTMTDHTGAFISGHLPAGNYIACAQLTTPGLLDPCHWAPTAPAFSVAAGKSTTGVTITMVKGAVLSIHVNDPHQLLTTGSAVIQNDLQFHVVTAKGHHYIAPITSSSKTSRDHTVTVPFGAPLTLQAIAPNLVLNDNTGKPAAAAGNAINFPAGATPATLTYTVIGAK